MVDCFNLRWSRSGSLWSRGHDPSQAPVLDIEKVRASERTLVVADLPFHDSNDKALTTLVKSYFQDLVHESRAVEAVIYPTSTKGVAYVIFREKKVAENIRQGKHYLTKKKGEAHFTVWHFSEKVFSCVRATLDLSVFGSHDRLESLVRGLQQKIPTLCFSSLQRSGKVAVQGSFLAFKMLHQSLLSEAKSFVEQNRKLFSERKKYHQQSTQRHVLRSSGSANSLPPSVPEPTTRGETLVLHTDIFLYLKHRCRIYDDTLKKSRVLCQERVDGEITTIYIKSRGSGTRPNNEKYVKELIEQFSHNLLVNLRKETFVLAGKENSERKNIRLACEQLFSKYPQILVNVYKTHIDIIGPSPDTYLFKRHVAELIGHRVR
ncbi:RNA-binding protein 43 [Sorex fumeus]|uniref:RNA-binding protein 43 n=1 Tax=Sorex fumeus TaxID=62283 RepID=UPI0024AC91B0|nr:RNA-binding protein 43 [Sorex fumeus]